MSSFTNTSLVSLVMQVLQSEAPEIVDGLSAPDPMRGATIPDDMKQLLVDEALRQKGAGLLLSIGQHLDRIEETPTIAVLTKAQSPMTLAGKWMRLERYYHATHRTKIVADGTNAWLCSRYSEGDPSSQAENCLIAGLLFGLICLQGLESAQLDIGDQSIPSTGIPSVRLAAMETCAKFRISWQTDTNGIHSREMSDGDVCDQLADLLADDIGRSWKVADAALEMAVSTRTLQRLLTARGRNFSSVLRRARMSAATEHLLHSDVGLAEIGYCCGYADQAHFQRDFLRVTNVTPKSFRDLAASI